MRPILSLNNKRNSLRSYTVFSGKHLVGNNSSNVSAANLDNLRLSQFRLGVSSTSRLANLTHHICHVVCLRTKKQMGGIDAAWIIAMMTYLQIVWNGTVIQFPGETMHKFGLAINVYLSMSRSHSGASPFPTTIRSVLVDLFPEAFYGGAMPIMPMNKSNGLTYNPAAGLHGICSWWRWLTATTFAEFYGRVLGGIIEGHSDLHSRCVKPWDVDASPGHFVASSIIPQIGGAL